jgi:hypothetical protein
MRKSSLFSSAPAREMIGSVSAAYSVPERLPNPIASAFVFDH